MASFPVALVPGAAGAGENPYRAAAQGAMDVMQQRNMAQALQTNAIRNQIAQTQLAEMQQQQMEQQTMAKVYTDSGGDMDKFFKNAAAAGVRPTTLMPLQQQYDQHVFAISRNADEQNKLQRDRMNNVQGALIGTFTNGYDDAGRPQWRDANAGEWKTWVDQQRSSGNISVQQADQLTQLHPDGSPPTADELRRYSATLYTGTQAFDQAEKVNQAQRANDLNDAAIAAHNATMGEANARTAGLEADNLRKAVNEAAPQLAGTDTVDEYDALRSKLPPNVAAAFPDWAKDYDGTEPIGAGDKKRLLNIGMTSDQVRTVDANEEYRKALLDNTAAYRNLVGQASKERADAYANHMNNPGGGKTLTPAQATAQKVNDLATRAINDSTTNGGSKIEDAIRNVQQFYKGDPDFDKYRGQVLSQLYKLQRQRDLANKGGQSSSLDQLRQMAGKGGAPASGGSAPAPASGYPAPKPQSSAKTFPRARLDAFAKANSMSSAQAETALKAQGYTIQ